MCNNCDCTIALSLSSCNLPLILLTISAAEVLSAPLTPDGVQEIGFREAKMSDPSKARQAERLGMGVGRVG